MYTSCNIEIPYEDAYANRPHQPLKFPQSVAALGSLTLSATMRQDYSTCNKRIEGDQTLHRGYESCLIHIWLYIGATLAGHATSDAGRLRII